MGGVLLTHKHKWVRSLETVSLLVHLGNHLEHFNPQLGLEGGEGREFVGFKKSYNLKRILTLGRHLDNFRAGNCVECVPRLFAFLYFYRLGTVKELDEAGLVWRGHLQVAGGLERQELTDFIDAKAWLLDECSLRVCKQLLHCGAVVNLKVLKNAGGLATHLSLVAIEVVADEFLKKFCCNLTILSR